MSRKSPFFSVVVLAAAVSAANAQAAEPASVRVGGFDVTPSVSLDNRYDTNIFAQAQNEKESWVTVLTPSVQAAADLGTVLVDGVYRHTAGIYQASSDDNFNDNYLDANAAWELNYRNQFDFGATYNDGHEDRGTGFSQGAAATTIAEPDTYAEKTVDAAYTYGGEESRGRLVFDAANYEKEYTNHEVANSGRDYDSIRGGAAFYWALGGKTDVLVEARQATIDYVNDPANVVGGFDKLDGDSRRYYAGVKWEATAKTEGTVKLGRMEKNFDDGDRKDFSGAGWDLGVKWSPLTYSSVSMKAARQDRETNGTGSFIDAKTYFVGWQHGWTDRISSNLFYSLDDETYEDAVIGRSDDTESVGLRVDYNLRRWMDVGVSYTDMTRDSNQNSFDYDRQQIALHLLLTM